MIYNVHQGTQLSAGQRLLLEQQRRVRSAMNSVLAEQVAVTIATLDARKEQGAKPNRIWVLDYECKGTLCIADWMGF